MVQPIPRQANWMEGPGELFNPIPAGQVIAEKSHSNFEGVWGWG